MERRNNLSLTSPAPAAAVPVPPTATDAAAVATTATLPSYATVTVGSYCAGTDKPMEAETTTTPANPQTMRSQVTALATRASERLSVVTKRRNIPQQEGGFSPSDPLLKLFLKLQNLLLATSSVTSAIMSGFTPSASIAKCSCKM